MNYNRITLVGRLVADPVLLTRSADNVVARFSLAVNRFKKRGEELEELADFFDCVTFNKNAEYSLNKLKKGMPVLVEGSLQTRTYQTKAGEKRKAYEVIVTLVRSLASGRSDSDGDTSNLSDEYQAAQTVKPHVSDESSYFEEDAGLEDPFA
jgi:single-strand DNA-binding protein